MGFFVHIYSLLNYNLLDVMFVCLFYKSVGCKEAGKFVPLVFRDGSSFKLIIFPSQSPLCWDFRHV